MKFKELKRAVEGYYRQGVNDEDEVVVLTADPSAGYSSNVEVQSISPGIDWDSGKILLSTKTPVYSKVRIVWDKIDNDTWIGCVGYFDVASVYLQEDGSWEVIDQSGAARFGGSFNECKRWADKCANSIMED